MKPQLLIAPIIVLTLILSGLAPLSGTVETIESGADTVEISHYSFSKAQRVLATSSDEPMIDPVLVEWARSSPQDLFETIIQFNTPTTSGDLIHLEKLGFDVLQEFTVIDGVSAVGPGSAILALEDYDRLFYAERNRKLEYQLDVSIETINADVTWNRIIVDDDGVLPEKIDGSGITVVISDTGIDATHPDLDYTPLYGDQRPEEGDKVIKNLKQDSPEGPWFDEGNYINTDVFGHGTHCAGISAGLGSAAGGNRKGVAPGAWLIGLSIGSAWETNEITAFDWVYEHSMPDDNIYNIRVVSNSWGYEPELDEYISDKEAVFQATMRLTFDNNVVVVFAASNDGGDGSESRTNIYGNVPIAISVAAAERDGSGIAGFSSRGYREDESTWPDIAAPGVHIMAPWDNTAVIMNPILLGGFNETYYVRASGTSMATPHIAGVVALLFQACPSLTISEVIDAQGDETSSFSSEQQFIHETELIMDLTARRLDPENHTGLPNETAVGHDGLVHDLAQGFGLVDVDKAVGLCLALSKLRDRNPVASVYDAFATYERHMRTIDTKQDTNVVTYGWEGEAVIDQDVDPDLPHTEQKVKVYIPEEATMVLVDLTYEVFDADPYNPLINVADVDLTIDMDGDGEEDWSTETTFTGHKERSIDVEGEYSQYRDLVWTFDAESIGFGLDDARSEYSVKVDIVVDSSDGIVIDESEYRHAPPASNYDDGSITLPLVYYDFGKAVGGSGSDDDEGPGPIVTGGLIIAALVVGLIVLSKLGVIGGSKAATAEVPTDDVEEAIEVVETAD